ncbi:hypothetical protein NDA01_00930 [Trichocoleus desertorum AS-A10]|uniref:hypothetical protein n=1 Tax=Trichocoleus desertorum TaxID=1481672 RepID=UPI003297C3B2
MFNFVGRLLLWLRGGSLKLLALAGIILLVWGTVSPVGTLIWWLNESAETLGLRKSSAKRLVPSDRAQVASGKPINCYIVFLTGVGDFSANQLTPGEEYFLNQLDQAHPDCVTVRDVFPYSAANESLGGRRLLAPVWRFADNADGWLRAASMLIQIRNLWRFAISADDRYGPLYNQGIATAIIDRMNAAHPITPATQRPLKIILMSTSGGTQVSLGAAEYLDQWLDTKVLVVSVGGVFSGTDGFGAAERVYHLQGQRDWVEDIGQVVFPSRWPWTVGSPFHQAQWQGRYSVHDTGPHDHDGPKGYFGEAIALPEQTQKAGQTKYVDLTLQVVNQLPIWTDSPTDQSAP